MAAKRLVNTRATSEEVVRPKRVEDAGRITIIEPATEPERQTAEVAEQAQFLATLLESIPDAVYFKDLESRFTLVSRHLATKLGLADQGEIVGKTDLDFFDREHAERALRDEQQIMRTGEPLVNIEE